MSDEFDPNWPHGHLLRWRDGRTDKVRILATDLPRDYPVAFCLLDGDWRGAIYCHRSDGTDGFSARLINAPAPVKHAEAWVNVWRHPDGGLYIGAHWDTLEEALDSKHSVNFIGAIRISTETADIIGPNGEKVKL